MKYVSLHFRQRSSGNFFARHCTFYPCTDVLQTEVWKLLQDVDDPELRRLIDTLPVTVLHSQATSSTKKYLEAFKRWKAWALEHALPALPAQGHHIALYLHHLANTLESISAAEEAFNAPGWVHTLAGVPSPAVIPFIKTTLESIQRMLAKPVHKKEPVTRKMLAELVVDTNRQSTLTNIRLLTACLLAFAGFLRFDELVHLRPCDIPISASMAKLRISQSKTDQLR